MRTVLLVLALFGCGSNEEECADLDQDGYEDEACGGLDCDDSNPDIRPIARDPGDDWDSRKTALPVVPRATVSENGELWLTYVVPVPDDSSTSARLGRWKGQSFEWLIPPIAMPYLDRGVQIGVGDDDVVHMLFHNGGTREITPKLVYVTLDGEVWSTDVLSEGEETPRYPVALSVRSDGDAAFAMTRLAGETSIVSLTDPDAPIEPVPVQISLPEGFYRGDDGEMAIFSRDSNFSTSAVILEDETWAKYPIRMTDVSAGMTDGMFIAAGQNLDPDRPSAPGELFLQVGAGVEAELEPLGITPHGHGFFVADDGTLHVVWHTLEEELLYRERSQDGVWSETHSFGTSETFFGPARLAVLPDGEVHIWHLVDGKTSAPYIAHQIREARDGIDNDCDGIGG